MNKPTPISLRVHTEVLKGRQGRSETKRKKSRDPKWPEYALVFDCETTIDELQTLIVGAYRFCWAGADGHYDCIEEGFFYADELPETDPAALDILRQFVKDHPAETLKGFPNRLRLLSRSEFMEQVFWQAADKAGALVVGFNLPFDLSRLAMECRKGRRRNEGWSFLMFQDKDPKTGRMREHPFRPWIKVTPKDSKVAFMRFTGVSIRSKKTGKRLVRYTPGRFLDLRTLGWALRNESYSLESACRAFGVPGKLLHEPSGRISMEEIEYCRQDVRATLSLLNSMRTEFDRHPIEMKPDRAFSPASIAKAYLKVMRVVPPLQKFNISPAVLGIAMQAYYGGRAECRIRNTPVPVVDLDVLSEYPTVNTLMGLGSLLIAKQLKMEEATDEISDLLANLTLQTVFKPEFWRCLTFFALVQPEGDILPVRTTYNGEVSNIGVNPLTSSQPIWYAGPDVVAATLLTGRPPKIIRAFRVIADGQQTGLKPVSLRGVIDINPRTDDFFKRVIEARAQVKSDESLSKQDREALSYFLKILANAGSYGLFVEINPDPVGTNPKTGKPARGKLRVYGGERTFPTTSTVVEKQGSWYCPIFASLITAAGRLLLALLERMVTDAGGAYLLCDTDSMAVVASEAEGLVACDGGPDRLADGREAVKALSWADVEKIVAKFEQLNPYDRGIVHGSILKIEDVNFGPEGAQRQLFGYAIAAKRYALFTQSSNDCFRVEKASAHGLGYLYAPTPGFDNHAGAPVWVVEAWDWILRGVLGLPRCDPAWFSLPAMMRLTITTPEVLKVLQSRQQKLPYRDRMKPFNFILTPILDRLTGGYPVDVDPEHFTLIAPFSSDPARWHKLTWVNVHDGKQYRLAQPGKRLPHEAEAKTYGDVISQYPRHPEAKSLAPGGNPCTAQTRGLLGRTPVTADGFRYIGKESDRHWEQGEDISLLDPFLLEYHPNETERLIADTELQHKCRTVSIRALAKAAGVSPGTVKAARRGDRIRKSTAAKIAKALKFTHRLLR